MKVRIWGARGSVPTPISSEEIEEKICQAIYGMPDINKQDMETVQAYVRGLPPLQRGTVGGNTTCAQVEAASETIILDAGTGLRRLGLDLMKGPCGKGQGVLHFVFTHPHWDHLQGFPLFVPAFIPGNQIIIHSVHDLEFALTDQQRFLYWPVSISYMSAEISFQQHEVSVPFSIGGVQINTIANNHPGVSYGYRFEDSYSVFVFAGDAEYKNLDDTSTLGYLEFFRGADALMFDAQYGLRDTWESKVDWGHSSAMIGVDFARKAGVKLLLLTHHEPLYNDSKLKEILDTALAYQEQNPKLPKCDVQLAVEGLALDLEPAATADWQVATEEDATVLTPTRTFDEQSVDLLSQHLERFEVGNEITCSVLDLSHVEILTTSSLKALVQLSRERDGEPVLLAGPRPEVLEVIKLAGYGDYFPVYPSVKSARKAALTRRLQELPGQMIGGHYQILERLGQGILGTVLKVQDTRTGTEVALKLFPPAIGKEAANRLERQLERIHSLEYPNIVRTLDWGWEGDWFYLVEPVEDATTLQATLDKHRGPLAFEDATRVALDVLRALENAHSHGIVHGHLRGQEVFLINGEVKLSGFGIGKMEEGRDLLTTPPMFLQADFLSPEQILGQPLDARTDLYALGVLLYRLFTGAMPFEGSEQEILEAHLEKEALKPRQRNPELSLVMEHIILKLMARNPNDRYLSAQQARRVVKSMATDVGIGEQPARRHLVGREKQLAVLSDSWELTQAGKGQIAFISGEPGIGKTSLAAEAASRSEAAVVLIGRCRERENNTAYQLFREVLQAYFATVPPELSDKELYPLMANFAQLVPGLRQEIPELPEPSRIDPEQEQLRIMSSLSTFIRRATENRPWFLVLDALQWIDKGSVELLRYLGRQISEMALFIVGTYRSVEIGEGHPLQALLRDLSGIQEYQQVPLERLHLPDVGQILKNQWDDKVPNDLIEIIFQHTEGNPFYVIETAWGLEEDDLVRISDGNWEYPHTDHIRLPQSVYEAVEGRIHYLEAETRDLLAQAAVLGESFRFEDLVALSGLPEGDVLEHLDLLLEKQLVQEKPGEEELMFSQGEIHNVIYNELGAIRRRRLHLRAGEVLEQSAQPNPAGIADVLAHHFFEAGEPSKALVYSEAAGRQALTLYAHDAALGWYNQALTLVAPGDNLTRFEILLSIEEIHHMQGDREAQEIDLMLLERVVDILRTGEKQAVAALRKARFGEATSDYAGAITAAKRAVMRLEEAKNKGLAARGHLTWGRALFRQGDFDPARKSLEKALQLAQAGDSPELAGITLRTLGNVAWKQGDYQGARIYYEQALSIARVFGDRQGEGIALNNLGLIYRGQGNYPEALGYFEHALEIALDIGDRQGEELALGNLGVVARSQGDYPNAQKFYEKALKIAREIGDRQGEGDTVHHLGLLAKEQGNHSRALGYFESALTLIREIGDRQNEGHVLVSLGSISVNQGDFTKAQEHLRQALELFREIGDQRSEGIANYHLGVMNWALGDYSNAHRTINQALSIFHEIGYRKMEGTVYYSIGNVAWSQGDYSKALDIYEKALAIAREIGDRGDEGYALTGLGDAHAELGNLEEAISAYQEAIILRMELGEEHLATESRAGLAQVMLAKGKPEKAREIVNEILGYLDDGHSLDGVEAQIRIYLTCCQVLQESGEPRAGEVLKTAYQKLMDQAANIPDESTRQSFLENVPWNREIVALMGVAHSKGESHLKSK